MAEYPQPAPSRSKEIGAAIAAAVLIAAPLAMKFEGYRSKVYRDPAHILTYCYGETQGPIDPARIYSKDECATKLRARMAKDYAPKIAQCLPAVATVEKKYIFGALLDASYNAGPDAVCKSRMARAIKAGQWSLACDGFNNWYTSALNRKTGVRVVFKGLVLRRSAEAQVCRMNFVSMATDQKFYPVGQDDGWPPMRFRKDNHATVFYVAPKDIQLACNVKLPELEACTKLLYNTVVLPNPCTFPDEERFARLACHELGHLNGWPGEHGP